ncbi:MAG: coenzyme F420-0:L-glutamate ligase [Candidatus Bruticola sp.]
MTQNFTNFEASVLPSGTVSFIPIHTNKEITAGEDLTALILKESPVPLQQGDIVIVTHKAVAKSEGRLVNLSQVTPSALASEYGKRFGKDSRLIELVLRESAYVVRMARGCLIVKTKQGFTCANAGIDLSNTGDTTHSSQDAVACLLPQDPDLSAQRLCTALSAVLGFTIPTIVSDSFGRPWREGIVNVAIGSCAFDPFTDYRGQADSSGRILKVTRMASADALASGAELACGKLKRVPFVIARGFKWQPSTLTAQALLRPEEKNFFP